ncbi:unnamed protein product [Lota lota]
MAVMLLCLDRVLLKQQLRSHSLLPAGPTSWGRAGKCSQHRSLLSPSGSRLPFVLLCDRPSQQGCSQWDLQLSC